VAIGFWDYGYPVGSCGSGGGGGVFSCLIACLALRSDRIGKCQRLDCGFLAWNQ